MTSETALLTSRFIYMRAFLCWGPGNLKLHITYHIRPTRNVISTGVCQAIGGDGRDEQSPLLVHIFSTRQLPLVCTVFITNTAKTISRDWGFILWRNNSVNYHDETYMHPWTPHFRNEIFETCHLPLVCPIFITNTAMTFLLIFWSL